jgi:streptogramin lyase
MPAVNRFILALIAAGLPALESTGAEKLVPLAGTGTRGFSGDGGPATAAQINNPFGVIRAPDHTIYFCDTGNHAIRHIDNDGIIRTVAGTGKRGFSGDGGPATAAQLNEPYEVRLDPDGNVVWVERLNHCVRRLDAKTGVISTIAGDRQAGYFGDDGPATRARFSEPHSIQFDPDGHLFVCDIGNHRLRRIEKSTGVITTFCGNGEKKLPPDGAPITGSPLFGPRAIDFAPDGSLWLALREGNAVLKLDLKAARIHHVIARDLHGPKGLAIGPRRKIFLADTEADRITFFDSSERSPDLKTLIGGGTPRLLARPHGIFVEADGHLLIGDTLNHRVWRLRGP